MSTRKNARGISRGGGGKKENVKGDKPEESASETKRGTFYSFSWGFEENQRMGAHWEEGGGRTVGHKRSIRKSGSWVQGVFMQQPLEGDPKKKFLGEEFVGWDGQE